MVVSVSISELHIHKSNLTEKVTVRSKKEEEEV